MPIPSVRLYKCYYFVYLSVLFFCELLLPVRYPFPLLTVGLAVAPLFFGLGYSIIVSFFWGLIMGVISYRTPFFYLGVYGVNTLSVAFIMRKFDHKLLVAVSCAVLISLVYCISAGAAGDISVVKLFILGLGMSAFCVVQTYVMEHCIYYRHD